MTFRTCTTSSQSSAPPRLLLELRLLCELRLRLKLRLLSVPESPKYISEGCESLLPPLSPTPHDILAIVCTKSRTRFTAER